MKTRTKRPIRASTTRTDESDLMMWKSTEDRKPEHTPRQPEAVTTVTVLDPRTHRSGPHALTCKAPRRVLGRPSRHAVTAGTATATAATAVGRCAIEPTNIGVLALWRDEWAVAKPGQNGLCDCDDPRPLYPPIPSSSSSSKSRRKDCHTVTPYNLRWQLASFRDSFKARAAIFPADVLRSLGFKGYCRSWLAPRFGCQPSQFEGEG